MNCRSLLLCTLSCIYFVGFGHRTLAANLVTFGLTGTVTTVDSPLSSQFATGNTVSGTVTFDSSSPDTFSDPALGVYNNLFSAAHLSFSNGYMANLSAGNSSMIVDNTGPDLFEIDVPMTGSAVSLFTPDLLDFALRDDQSVMLTSDHIPTIPPSVALSEAHDGFLRFKSGQTSAFVNFNLTSLTAVPEPTAVALLIVAMSLTSTVRRRPNR